ncbi:MAG: VOC family protein [Gammaproteobacteria bacterium]
MSDTLPALGIQRVKVIALAVRSLERANRFYEDMLGLARAFEGAEHVGWQLDEIVLMLKPDWETPTATPNPRITLASVDAMATQAALRARGIEVADEVQAYGDFLIGSFLDSEGNKLWFCSPVVA